MNKEFSLGLVEVSGLGHAIIMLDDMLKAGDVEFVATERKLGGRLVTIVVRGELTSVKASVDAGVRRAQMCGDGIFKASQVIARPHPEIFPFLHLNEEEEIQTEESVAENKTVKKTTTAKTTAKKSSPKRKAAPKNK